MPTVARSNLYAVEVRFRRSPHALTRAFSIAELHSSLRQELTRQLSADGWVVDPAADTEPGSITIGSFRRALTGDFSATAQFFSTGGPPHRATLGLVGIVGLSHAGSYRLWPVLLDSESNELEIDLDDLLRPPRRLVVEISDISDASRAVEELVLPVREHVLEWARQYATVDALIEAYHADSELFVREVQVVPVLLAAIGRHDEARSALADYLKTKRPEVRSHEYKRLAYQLTRWLDAGAVLPDAPTESVGPRYRRSLPT